MGTDLAHCLGCGREVPAASLEDHMCRRCRSELYGQARVMREGTRLIYGDPDPTVRVACVTDSDLADAELRRLGVRG